MFPDTLYIRTLFDPETSKAKKREYLIVLYKRKTEENVSSTELYSMQVVLQPGNLTDSVFIDGDSAYRIRSMHENPKIYYEYLLEIEEYTCGQIMALLPRKKEIKENLLVCADRLEDLGALPMASMLRELAEKVSLESLTLGNQKILWETFYTDYPRAHTAVKK